MSGSLVSPPHLDGGLEEGQGDGWSGQLRRAPLPFLERESAALVLHAAGQPQVPSHSAVTEAEAAPLLPPCLWTYSMGAGCQGDCQVQLPPWLFEHPWAVATDGSPTSLIMRSSLS